MRTFAFHFLKSKSSPFAHKSSLLFTVQKAFASKKDLYEIMGVNKNSTQDEIKKAYYKLAQKYHPDKNSSPDAKNKFAEINNAYETLGDESKRKVFDTMGMTSDDQFHNQQAGGFSGGDPFSAFSEFWSKSKGQGAAGAAGAGGNRTYEEDIFDDFASFFDMGSGPERKTKGQDIFINLEINFMDSVSGARKEILFEKRGICTTCNGSKCKPGTAPSKCTSCGGKGYVNFRQGPMTIQMTCNKCKGIGVTIKSPCQSCKATGIGNTHSKEEIQIPKGINNGQNLRLSGKGNQSETGGVAGDLIIKVTVKPDTYFRREGYDIITDSYITISQAVLGHSVEVKTLYGMKQIKVEKGTQHGQKIKLANHGITKLAPNQHQKGDHYVVLKIQIPNKLTDKQKELFVEIAKLEEKVDTTISANDHSENEGKEKKGQDRGNNEQEKEDIFGKFKNMWGGR